ncbi:MAG: hypothetical protein ACI9U2_002971 [Bradymonadia bacterium]|jgi:hypothetical protein
MYRSLIVLALIATPAYAHAEETLRLDLALTYDRFEQQVKSEIGGARGERLVEESFFGLQGAGTWRVWGPIALGWYAQLDSGARNAGRFVGLDADNMTVTEGQVGGDFTEFWTGPLVRASWRGLFVELGYGVLGLRDDDARGDLRDENGGTDDALRTTPTVAWMLGFGGAIEVHEGVDVVLRAQYRVRYYNRRGDTPLENELVHGTQNFTPFFGVAWRPAL